MIYDLSWCSNSCAFDHEQSSSHSIVDPCVQRNWANLKIRAEVPSYCRCGYSINYRGYQHLLSINWRVSATVLPAIRNLFSGQEELLHRHRWPIISCKMVLSFLSHRREILAIGLQGKYFQIRLTHSAFDWKKCMRWFCHIFVELFRIPRVWNLWPWWLVVIDVDKLFKGIVDFLDDFHIDFLPDGSRTAPKSTRQMLSVSPYLSINYILYIFHPVIFFAWNSWLSCHG